ncbi:hypothetical protein P3W85_02455 [Cupriavidus basilensis]|uniref:Uncharacterized protein n=1 Tax=Cupriavidus basilensis TaxID=68895 RepID=A0ABT6AHP5_9BURK|nr:hypothetical protein [Cupriavidus basilensis]MDF3831822.1 hypothetical protein [Cupriavidus basilensis]
MALCVQVNGSGALVAVSPQPADLSTCAYVVQASSEFLNNPLALSAGDGQTIGTAILLVWAVAYAIRAVLGALASGDDTSALS